MTNFNDKPYVIAPPGSPDKFRLIQDELFVWRNPPLWCGMLIKSRVDLPEGSVTYTALTDTISVIIKAPFYFAVSVAPNFHAARMAACVHDWLYGNAEALAKAWGCSTDDVLRLADHWFLAQMRGNGFALAVTYYLGVRVFGAAFHKLFGKSEKRAASTGEGQSDQTKEDTHHA